MALDPVRAALTMIAGIGEATRARAQEAAEGLLQVPGVGPTAARAAQVTDQVTTLADEILAAATANRSMVADTVRAEVDLQLQRVGLTTTGGLTSAREEIDRLKAEVADLRRALAGRAAPGAEKASTESGNGTADAAHRRPSRSTLARAAADRRSSVGAQSPARPSERPTTSGATEPAAKSASAKKSAGRSTASKSTPSSTSAAKKSAAKKSTAKKAAVKRATATKTTASKTTASKPAAKRSAPATTSSSRKSAAEKSSTTSSTPAKKTATTKTAGSRTPATEAASVGPASGRPAPGIDDVVQQANTRHLDAEPQPTTPAHGAPSGAESE